MDTEEPIPLSALQHAVYCRRQAGLIHLERLWEENRFTAEGQQVHLAVDREASRLARGVRRVSALPLASRRLGLAGVADLVEFHREGAGERAYPVEYKRGRPKPHQADAVQLCAQALCLEEMLGQPVPCGALYYAETKRRQEVAFEPTLRALTEATAADLRAMFASGRTPPPPAGRQRCRGCSLLDLCQPAAVTVSARAWRDRHLAALLAGNEAEGSGT